MRRFSLRRSESETSTYIQFEGDRTFIKLKSGQLDSLITDPEYYRMRRLFQFDLDRVSDLTFSYKNGRTFLISKKEGQWYLDNSPADPIFVKQLLLNLSELEAVSFRQGEGSLIAEYLTITVRLNSTDNGEMGKELQITVSALQDRKSGRQGYRAKVKDLEDPFIISESTFKRIAPKPESLLR